MISSHKIFPVGSFGHTGFTGTTLWIDPGSGTYVILLANAIHPRGNPTISKLQGDGTWGGDPVLWALDRAAAQIQRLQELVYELVAYARELPPSPRPDASTSSNSSPPQPECRIRGWSSTW
jgi:CubicO group peptidase (beta-lactamase class C family)